MDRERGGEGRVRKMAVQCSSFSLCLVIEVPSY